MSQDNRAVAVETLAVKTMLQNRSLAKAIAAAGWHGLVTKLAYKAERAGKHLVEIDRFIASSKTCSGCGQGQGSDEPARAAPGLRGLRRGA